MMYAPTNQCWSTDACAGTVMGADGRCVSCNEPMHVTVRTSTNVVTGDPHRIELTIIRNGEEVTEEEILEPLPRPVSAEEYRPRMRNPGREWRSKWRLTQQRPRDGLR